MFNWIGSEPFAKCSITIRRGLECLSHNTPSWRRQFLKIKREKKKRKKEIARLSSAFKSTVDWNSVSRWAAWGPWVAWRPSPSGLVLGYCRGQSQESHAQDSCPAPSTRDIPSSLPYILIFYLRYCSWKGFSCFLSYDNKIVANMILGEGCQSQRTVCLHL